jgi:hypothetical protein
VIFDRDNTGSRRQLHRVNDPWIMDAINLHNQWLTSIRNDSYILSISEHLASSPKCRHKAVSIHILERYNVMSLLATCSLRYCADTIGCKATK